MAVGISIEETHEVNDIQFNYGKIMECIVTHADGIYS
jgi:hypothetical protein